LENKSAWIALKTKDQSRLILHIDIKEKEETQFSGHVR
jgi:hypothetical protein